MNTARKAALGGAMLLATMTGGAIGASLVGVAGAQTDPSTTTTTVASGDTDQSTDAGSTTDARDESKGPHQANGITETTLTGDEASKAEAAALAAVPGGSVERAETDAEGAEYEVHMTTSDGSDVTVKLDAEFNVTETIDGHG